MTIISNTDPAQIDLLAVAGDSIDLTIYISKDSSNKFYAGVNSAPASGSPYSMTDLRIQVRRKDGLLLKDWLSGISPSDIVVYGNYFHIVDSSGFDQSGFFDYEVSDETNSVTIMRGTFYIKKEITT